MFKYKVLVVGGLSKQELLLFEQAIGESDIPLLLRPLRETERTSKVGEVIEATLAHGPLSDPNGASVNLPWPMVFFAVYPRMEIDATIDAFKRVINRRAVYASLTPDNMLWTWKYLLEHLGEEHQYFLDKEQDQRNNEDDS